MKTAKTTSCPQIIANFLTEINWKVAICLFFMGLFVFSDMFIDVILRQFEGSVDGIVPNTKGTTIQVTLLVLFYVIVDTMVRLQIL